MRLMKTFVSAERRIFFVTRSFRIESCGDSSLCALVTPPLARLTALSEAEALNGELGKDEWLSVFWCPAVEMGLPFACIQGAN
jgi:hypothetical protein